MTPDDPRHGTASGYTNYGCRCDECRAANTEQKRRWKARQTPLPAGDWRHGTDGYSNYRCRCDICQEAWRLKTRADQAARVAKGLPPGDPRHGTTNGYSAWGCRCSECREAIRMYRWRKRHDPAQT